MAQHRRRGDGIVEKLVESYIKKGTKLIVEGQIQYDKVGEGEDTKFFTRIAVQGGQGTIALLPTSNGTRRDGPDPTDDDALREYGRLNGDPGPSGADDYGNYGGGNGSGNGAGEDQEIPF